MHQFRDLPSNQNARLLTAVVGALLLLSSCGAPGVKPDPLLITATIAPPTTATQGEAYAGFSVAASGGEAPYVFSLQGDWPAGITVDAAGAVSGIPTGYGAFANLSVQVEDSNGASASFDLEAALEVLAALPTLSLEELPHWWATTPAAPLKEFSTLRLQFTMRNISGETLEFTGDAGGSDPFDELQLWFTPATFATSPTLSMDVFPQGSYVDGVTMTWDLTIELSSLAGDSTGIAIRPSASPIGNAGPNRSELVSFDVTVAR